MEAYINDHILERAGLCISKLSFKEEFHNRPFLTKIEDAELQAAMLYYAVSICHQTYALQDPSRNLYGWDYLEDGFLRMAIESPELLSADTIISFGIAELSQALLPWFSPDGIVMNSTLDRITERARLMFDAAYLLSKQFKGSVLELLASTNGLLLNNGNGYYEVLQPIEAFSDNHRKKSSFLLKLLCDSKLFMVKDNENVIPVMDYHMQRVLLRTGIVSTDDELTEQLISRKAMDSDEVVRTECIKAMKLISKRAGVDILRMNDVFYMLGRSCCLESPLCKSGVCSKHPCSLTITLDLASHERCIFDTFCSGVTSDLYINKWHPVVSTHFY